MDTLLLFAVILLAFWVGRLQGRVRHLEGRAVAAARAASPAEPATLGYDIPAWARTPAAPAVAPAPASSKAEEQPAAVPVAKADGAARATPADAGVPAESAGSLGGEPNLARLPFWLGAISLVVGAMFLVGYSIENGLLSPGVRTSLGVLLGLGFLGAGFSSRAADKGLSEGFHAAGVGTLYASLLAATSLYQLVPSGLGFLLMAANTALALALSLRGGRLVGYVGIVGGMLTPGLISTGGSSAAALFAYLALLAAGATAVAWRRECGGMLAASLLGSLAWLVVWNFDDTLLSQQAPGFLFAAYAWALSSVAWRRARLPEPWPQATIPWVATPLAIIVLAFGCVSADWAWLAYCLIGAIGVGSLELAQRGGSLRQLPYLAWAVTLAGFLGSLLSHASMPGGLALLVTALVFGIAPAILADRVKLPTGWSNGSPLVLLVTYLVLALTEPVSEAAFKAILVATALGYGALAAWRMRALGDLLLFRDRPLARVPTDGFVAAAWGFGILGHLAVADVGAVALSLLAGAPVLAVLFDRVLKTKALPAVAALAAVASLLPAIPDFGASWPAVDALTDSRVPLTAAVVAALLGAAAWLARPLGSPNPFRALQGAAGVACLVLAFSACRWLVQAATGAGPSWNGWTTGTVPLALGGTAAALLALASRPGLDGFRRAGAIGFGLAALWFVLGPLTGHNPLIAHIHVGDLPVLNGLVVLYGIPAAALFALAVRLPIGKAWAVELAAVGVGLLFVLAEVRQAFTGGFLGGVHASEAYTYAVSVALVAYAAGLIGYGIARGSWAVRKAGLALLTFAAGKVFLYDASALDGLWRVCSFIGLGLALMGIGHLFQRLERRGG